MINLPIPIPPRRRSHLAILLLLFSTNTLVSSEWEYIPPLFTCSPTLSNCPSSTHECLANPNHPQSTADVECEACHKDQKFWPCDVDGLCYCWDKSTPKIPPAPSTRHYNGGEGLNVSQVDPCDILSPRVFDALAPEAQAPYSYTGFCSAVQKYNQNHPTEGIFNMGTRSQQMAELAAFFGNALHESDELKAGREYLMCADRQEVGGEVYCRPCDSNSFDWDAMQCPEGASLASQGRAFNGYCQSNLLPPEGCRCDDVYERAARGPMAGYVKANEVYFGRGSIQLSWNYNYIRASVALTGAPETFCQRPDLVATNEEYAWGAGLFYWMENIKNDKTCHQSVLLHQDFGESLDNINGGLECPADDHGWHGKAVQLRLNRYCRSATAIGVEILLGLGGCLGMERRMMQCLREGTCRDCKVWEGSLGFDGQAAVAAAAHDDGGGGKNKDKNKQNNNSNNNNSNGGGRTKAAKQEEAAKQAAEEAAKQNNDSTANNNSEGGGGRAKAGKQQELAMQKQQEADKSSETVSSGSKGDKEKNEQQTATSANVKPQTAARPSQADDASTSNVDVLVTTPNPTPSPTAQPTHSPKQNPHRSCTGKPCLIPPGMEKMVYIEFCRSSDNICGAGPSYCNDDSMWTSFCHDSDLSTVSVGTSTSTSFGGRPTIISGSKPQPLPRTRRPTNLLTKNPTPNPTNASVKSHVNSSAASQFGNIPTPAKPMTPVSQPQASPSSSSASQFGIIPTPITKPAAPKLSASQPQGSSSSSSSHASQFAMHSKGRSSPVGSVEQATVIRPKDDDDTPAPVASSPTESPIGVTSYTSSASQFGDMTKESPIGVTSYTSSASQFGDMTNWANTKLEYPPTDSPVVVDTPLPSYSPAIIVDPPTDSPVVMDTPLPSYSPAIIVDPPTDSPVVVDTPLPSYSPAIIVDPPTDSPVVVDTLLPSYSPAIIVDESEVLTEHSIIKDALSNNYEVGESNNQEKEETASTTAVSYFTKLNDDSFIFSPMDDVTISRVYSTDNFGSEPVVVVDMLEGDAALLRFDLSAVGDGTIQKAVLRLTANDDDGVNHAGVYYVQPTVNGWTEKDVTYDTAPKAGGALFASVASRSKDDGNQFEMDVTEAVANHVVSFRVIGTDRVRSEFSSKESSVLENAPVLLVTLESSSMEAAEESVPGSVLHSKEDLGDEDNDTNVQANVSEELNVSKQPNGSEEAPSSSGIVSGHIWHDKNEDGIQDSIEPGLRGILVDLYKCNSDQWLEGTRTASGGDYIFNKLEEGEYYVLVTVSSDYGFSVKGAGSDDDDIKDSDIDPSTGRGDCVELSSSSSSGQLSADVNAGIIDLTPKSVSDTIVEVSTIPDSPVTVSESEVSEDSPSHNCRGKPCTEGADYCRSKFNFCGVGEEYCNEDSQWIFACGTPLPTYQPSTAPTTGEPTFIHDPDVHCSGEPCEEGDITWCRSEIGYCGSGSLYCNSDSTWMSNCDDATISSSAPTTNSPSATSSPTSENTQTSSPTLSPTSGEILGFSPFALPTLSQIVTPKKFDIHSISTTSDGDGQAPSSEDEQTLSVQTDASSPAIAASKSESESETMMHSQPQNNNADDEPWYVRYSDVAPVSRNPGFRSIPGSMCVFSIIVLFRFM